MLPDEDGVRDVDGARVSLLLGDTDLRQIVD